MCHRVAGDCRHESKQSRSWCSDYVIQSVAPSDRHHRVAARCASFCGSWFAAGADIVHDAERGARRPDNATFVALVVDGGKHGFGIEIGGVSHGERTANTA